MCLQNIETQRWESCQCFVNSRFYFLSVLLNSWVVLKQDLCGETHGINQGWWRGPQKWSCILALCRVMSAELRVLSLPVWVVGGEWLAEWAPVKQWVGFGGLIWWQFQLGAWLPAVVPCWHSSVCCLLCTCWDVHRGYVLLSYSSYYFQVCCNN